MAIVKFHYRPAMTCCFAANQVIKCTRGDYANDAYSTKVKLEPYVSLYAMTYG